MSRLQLGNIPIDMRVADEYGIANLFSDDLDPQMVAYDDTSIVLRDPGTLSTITLYGTTLVSDPAAAVIGRMALRYASGDNVLDLDGITHYVIHGSNEQRPSNAYAAPAARLHARRP